MARMEVDCTLNFSKFSYPSLRQNECTMDYSSCKELIDVLVLIFKAMFSAREKLENKDFCIVLAGKQKCRDRAPLNHTPYFSAPFYWISLWMRFHVLLTRHSVRKCFLAVYRTYQDSAMVNQRLPLTMSYMARNLGHARVDDIANETKNASHRISEHSPHWWYLPGTASFRRQLAHCFGRCVVFL